MVLFFRHAIESDYKHIPSAVVDTKLVSMRPACMIAVIGAINSHNSATGAAFGPAPAKCLGPNQLTFQ